MSPPSAELHQFAAIGRLPDAAMRRRMAADVEAL